MSIGARGVLDYIVTAPGVMTQMNIIIITSVFLGALFCSFIRDASLTT